MRIPFFLFRFLSALCVCACRKRPKKRERYLREKRALWRQRENDVWEMYFTFGVSFFKIPFFPFSFAFLDQVHLMIFRVCFQVFVREKERERRKKSRLGRVQRRKDAAASLTRKKSRGPLCKMASSEEKKRKKSVCGALFVVLCAVGGFHVRLFDHFFLPTKPLWRPFSQRSFFFPQTRKGSEKKEKKEWGTEKETGSKKGKKGKKFTWFWPTTRCDRQT